jgi:TonB family protein
MAVSALLHLVLILFLIFYSKVAPGPEVITEILWLEPEEVQMAAAAPNVTERIPERQLQTVKAREPVHFERILRRAEVEPNPQSDRTLSDKLNERLASLQESAIQRASLSPINVNMPVPSRPALAAAEPAAGPPRELKHAEPARGTPAELRRIQERQPVPVAPAAAAPAVSKPTKAENPQAVRNLAGMTLVGPVADRRILAYAAPRYPEWAKREAVEGSVRLHFVVLADGAIKENIMVQKTSGYEDFDGNAVAALKTWKFEPLGKGEAGEQWGEITFNYRLNAGE